MIAFLIILSSCSRREHMKGVHIIIQKPEIRQRYGGEMGALADELKSAGVTHVIVPVYKDGTAYYPSDILPQRWTFGTDLLAFRHALRRVNIDFVAQLQIFEDNYTFKTQPELRAMDEFASTRSAENISGICPSNRDYRQYKLDIIREIMLIFQPDGIYLDKLSFPVETGDDCSKMQVAHTRQFCFCNHCVKTFAQHAQIDLPEHLINHELNAWILDNHEQAWLSWKTGTINELMEKANIIIKDLDPTCKIMLGILPWEENDPNFGRQRLTGQDVKTLAVFTDHYIMSTSCYIPDDRYDQIQLSILKEINGTDSKVIPTIELQLNPVQNNEERFKNSLQHFKNKVIVSDWGYMIKNRRYLNIFISEHNK